MRRVLILSCLSLFLYQVPAAYAASFPETIKYKEVTDSPMIKITSIKSVEYSYDPKKYREYEEREQQSPAGLEKTIYLREDGKIHMYEPGRGRCTITDVPDFKKQNYRESDAIKMAEDMKKAMGLTEAGTCEGAGRPGRKFSSAMGNMCFDKEYEFFPLWTKVMGSNTEVVEVAFNVKLEKMELSLPSSVKCEKGPDLEQILGGMRGNPGARGGAAQQKSYRPQAAPDINMEEAMKQAQEAMKQAQEMYKANPR